jgi:uncharacterized protein DUF6756
MSIRDEIDDARRRLGLSADELAEVPDAQARDLTAAFLAHFTGGVDARWWWEHFSPPVGAARFPDGKGFTHIAALVPDALEKVWFVAEDDQLPYFPVYDVTPSAAQAVIGECYGFEYYLIAKDLTWLLCENHHDTMIAVGRVRERLAAGLS